MALRVPFYSDPQSEIIWSKYCDTADVASATSFARFRARAKIIVTSITAIVTSAASAAQVILTVQRDASANTTITIASATSAGAMTTVSCAITLGTAGLIDMVHDETKGEWQVIYEYRVVYGEGMYNGL